jgi:AraC-like DNA-binding protein
MQDERIRSHWVLPDGCIDVLFELEGSKAGTAVTVGMMTRPAQVGRAGTMNILAVRFRPGGAAAFFSEALATLTDAEVPLQDLWHGSQDLCERIADCRTRAQGFDMLASQLRRRLRPPQSPRLRACEAAIECMEREPEVRIDTICAKLGLTRQTLATAFREYVGVSPKLLTRILRLQRALRLADAEQSNRTLSWAQLSQDAGYYDQPHLVKEFQSLTGRTPDALVAERQLTFTNLQD